MSILIKGMKMPTRCGRCDMRITEYDAGVFDHYECCITAAIINNLGEKMEDCPIINVPAHGRLIDADALYEECALDNKYEVAATTTRINEYMQLKIDDAPTIFPAEEDET